MKTIKITRKEIDTIAKGCYQYDCVVRGHQPGVLSGAELKGDAKKWGASYAGSRAVVASRIYTMFGIVTSLMLIDSRWCRVWAVQHRAYGDSPYFERVVFEVTA